MATTQVAEAEKKKKSAQTYDRKECVCMWGGGGTEHGRLTQRCVECRNTNIKQSGHGTVTCT